MKKHVLNLITVAVFTIAICFSGEVLAGPPGGGGGPGGQGGCIPPPCVPIDGGLTALVIAGAAFGGKKIFDSMKN